MTPPRLPSPRPELRSFTAYGAGRAPATGVRLLANEWPEPNPAGAHITQAELDRIHLNRYPGPAVELRAILSERYGVAPDQLIFGNGSNDVLLSTFLIFGGHGRTTLLFQPTYAMHARLSTIAGGRVANEQIGLPYVLTRERALEAMARVRPEIVCFCTPNNPTGGLIDEEVILSIAEAYPETLVLVDEAYSDFPGTTVLPALADHPNVVVSKTFSKVHAAAGLRMGILVVGRELAEAFRAIQFPANVSVVTYALAAKIARDTVSVRRRVELCRTERERVYEALRRVDGIEAFPAEANFLLFRIRGDTAAAAASFAREGVLLRDMSSWTGCEGCLRVSIGTPDENDRFIAALGSVFEPAPAA